MSLEKAKCIAFIAAYIEEFKLVAPVNVIDVVATNHSYFLWKLILVPLLEVSKETDFSSQIHLTVEKSIVLKDTITMKWHSASFRVE